MSTVFDASALIPLTVSTAHSAEAALALEGAARPLAPSWVLAEIAQALWKWARARAIPDAAIVEGYQSLASLDIEMADATSHVASALTIALARRHSVYDCLYIATALAEDAELVTADRRLATIARECGVPVRLLGGAPDV